jgi:dephospho-CoA kinase
MTKIIGLTGGIGSGKTTVANLFREHGIPVYIADDEARTISDSPEVVKHIADVFGDDAISNGRLDRKKMAGLVFDDPEKLKKLNAIIHPAVRNHFLAWLEAHKDEPIVIKEAAILFETGNDKDCDAVITVTAPLEIRIKRVMERDKTSREEILKRIDNQWNDEKRISKSDFTIYNVNFNETAHQTVQILKKLMIL